MPPELPERVLIHPLGDGIVGARQLVDGDVDRREMFHVHCEPNPRRRRLRLCLVAVVE